MDVRVIEEPGRRSIDVQVLAPHGSQRARTLAERIRTLCGRMYAYPIGTPERRPIALDTVALFEIVGGRTLIRLRNGATLESPSRLFELETALEATEFLRTSRQVIVNFDAVRSVRPELNGRLVLELEGTPPTLVTRTYVPAVRAKLAM